MKNKLFELSMIAGMFSGGRGMPKMKVGKPKTHKKDLEEYRIPPRSMTPAERDYYAIHKNLNGFYA